MILAIDPGSKAGFAVVGAGGVVWCTQVDTSRVPWDVACARYQRAIDEARAVAPGNVEIVMEAPCYAANRRRKEGTTPGLAERVGMIRALVWTTFERAPQNVLWRDWQAIAHRGRVLGTPEERSLGYVRDVLRVPEAWIVGPKGGVLWDAVTACAIGGAAQEMSCS